MRKLIAAINMTLDGYCDHTAVTADEELHRHYTELLSKGGCIIYGRITYQLMESYWPSLVLNPTGNRHYDEFATVINNIPKIVFSQTLTNIGWENARLATRSLEEEVSDLRNQPGGDILVGSRSLILALLKINLLDELQLCVHPVIAGSGLPLFKGMVDRITLELFKTKTFGSGAVTLYFKR